jgi:hypothetical protein
MPINRPISFNHCILRFARSVVSENIKRVFAGMKPGVTRFHLAFVCVRLANFVLEVAALPILAESFVADHCSLSLVVHLAMRCDSMYAGYQKILSCASVFKNNLTGPEILI